MAEILKIVANPDAAAPDLRSVAQCLRNLADNIDRGECGEVIRAAVVLRSAGLEPIVCGQGDTTVAQTYMDLHAGAQQLMAMTAGGCKKDAPHRTLVLALVHPGRYS